MNTPPRAVPAPTGELELRGHLFIHHSLYTVHATELAELHQAHNEDHAGPLKPVHPHTHPAPAPEQEWNWE